MSQGNRKKEKIKKRKGDNLCSKEITVGMKEKHMQYLH